MSDPFVSDATWVGSCFFGGFVWKHVVSLKSPTAECSLFMDMRECQDGGLCQDEGSSGREF